LFISSISTVWTWRLFEAVASRRARFLGNVKKILGLPRAHVLRREKPDLLHAHFGPDAVMARPLADALNIPLVATLHGFDINIARRWWKMATGAQRCGVIRAAC